MDGDFGAHARHEVLTTVVVKRNNHGNTLADFREVAAGVVLGGQQRELRSRRLHNLLHVTAEGGATIGVDGDINLLADADVVDGALIHVGHDGEVASLSNLDDG